MKSFLPTLVIAALLAALLSAPAFAASYPVQGKWGESNSTDKTPVDCTGLRTIDFQGERRFDSGGGVPDFRALTVERQGQSAYGVTEEFNTGQINARNTITLRVLSDPDRLELAMASGGTIKLRKCK